MVWDEASPPPALSGALTSPSCASKEDLFLGEPQIPQYLQEAPKTPDGEGSVVCIFVCVVCVEYVQCTWCMLCCMCAVWCT